MGHTNQITITMLVNAHQFPAPAMWQGLMLIGIAIWALYVLNGDPSKTKFKTSIIVLGIYTLLASFFVAKTFY